MQLLSLLAALVLAVIAGEIAQALRSSTGFKMKLQEPRFFSGGAPLLDAAHACHDILERRLFLT